LRDRSGAGRWERADDGAREGVDSLAIREITGVIVEAVDPSGLDLAASNLTADRQVRDGKSGDPGSAIPASGVPEKRSFVPLSFDLPDCECYGRTNANVGFSEHSWPSST